MVNAPSRLLRYAVVLTYTVVILVNSCSKKEDVEVASDHNVDFKSYETWAWLPDPTVEAGDTLVHLARTDSLDKLVRKSIAAKLQKKGLSFDPKSPQVRVGYYLATNIPWCAPSDFYLRLAQVSWNPSDDYQNPFIIAVVDADSKMIIWRAKVDHLFSDEVSDDNLKNIIDRSVSIMLAHYPPPIENAVWVCDHDPPHTARTATEVRKLTKKYGCKNWKRIE